MARIPYPSPEDISDKAREDLAKLPDINIFRMLSYSDHLLGPFIRLGNGFLYKGKLDPVLREIAILRVGYLSGATYETFQHERIGRGLGMSDDLIAAIKAGPDDPVFTPLETLVMRYTDDVVKNVRAGDALFEAVGDQLSVPQVQELTLVIGYYMMVSRFLETFGVDIETDGRQGPKIGAQ